MDAQRAQKLRVILVGDFPPPHGGVATHVEDLFRAVRAHGGDCVVLDIGKGQLPADGVIPARRIARLAAHLAARAAQGYRIHLHTNGANPKSWALAALCAAAGRIAGHPALVTLHSGLAPAWLAASRVRRGIAARVGNHFARVIAVSEPLRSALAGSGIDPERIEVLPAFSKRFLEPGAPPAGLREMRAEAAPLLCAMIAPEALYGIDVLLAAFARVREALPRARLALYGHGAVQADGVRVFGALQRPQALALLAACDVFVRPTLVDGDSVSVREALALGRAVVATRVGTRPPEARLVPPGDADALARELLEVARELAARPVRTVAPPREPDCVQRLLELYGPEAPCAASAAS